MKSKRCSIFKSIQDSHIVMAYLRESDPYAAEAHSIISDGMQLNPVNNDIRRQVATELPLLVRENADGR